MAASYDAAGWISERGSSSWPRSDVHKTAVAAPSAWVPLSSKISLQGDGAEDLFEYGNGYPCVPPTEARVRALLAATRRAPTEVLGICPPNNNEVTVEKAAINAVLAGCAPRHFRVALAAVEAMLDPVFGLHGNHATTMGATPLVVASPLRPLLFT